MRRLIVVLGLLGWSLQSPVSAVPLLTLDIAGGTYDSGSETIVATENPFTLYALFNTEQGSASGTYYISAAIVPKTLNPPMDDFGSFKIDGVTYSLANMAYGNPPASATQNSGELPSHDIYDTHYFEIAFTFDLSKRAELYNSQDNPGGFEADSEGDMLYEDFLVDISGLAAGYNVHFDLYSITTDKRGNTTIDEFAPFSKDAQSGPIPPLTVSDASSTMILLGMAMLALEGVRRRIVR